MADDKSQRGQQDRTRVNVNEEYELRYWTDKFGVTAVRLKDAVAAVGTSTKKVEEYLKR